MRRILNILQATSMAYDVVNEHNVYACTGNPLPRHIEEMATSLLNDSFADAYSKIHTLQREMGYAIADLVNDLYRYMLKLDFPPAIRVYLFDHLAQLE